MATPLGSFIKAFVVAILTIIGSRQADGTLCFDATCIKDILIASTFAIIPVVINWINPQYKQYGEGSNEHTLSNPNEGENTTPKP